MIDISVYKLLHLLGLIAVFVALGAGLGASLGASENRATPMPKWMAPVHGTGLTVMIVAGFGMLARLGVMSGGNGMPLWVLVKLAVWLALAGMLVLVKRRKISIAASLILLLSLGGLAAGMAIWKP